MHAVANAAPLTEIPQMPVPSPAVNDLMLVAGVSRQFAEVLAENAVTIETLNLAPVGIEIEPELIPEEIPIEDVVEIVPAVTEYRCLGEFKTTYYCCERYRHICGTGNGITATGTEVTPGRTIAVDPKVIPLGSTVLVDFGDGDVRTYVAEDTGGLIKGNHIDIAVATHHEALHSCNGTVTVYLAPEG
ncbi:MAG: 3D domain-containing protein [Candidatus Saccharibacteria bacterium]|nr:3D domain-containing protein [Candidatus Saccharibacteria bacterium]